MPSDGRAPRRDEAWVEDADEVRLQKPTTHDRRWEITSFGDGEVDATGRESFAHRTETGPRSTPRACAAPRSREGGAAEEKPLVDDLGDSIRIVRSDVLASKRAGSERGLQESIEERASFRDQARATLREHDTATMTDHDGFADGRLQAAERCALIADCVR